MARTAAGEMISPGNSFSTSAPASNAAKASVGVITPGAETRSSDLAQAITSGFMLGDTMICPPAPATAWTSSSVSTVPAPTTARPSSTLARWRIDSSGSGEFSGTSMMRMPAETSASPTPVGLVRADAAQDGDQRARGESRIEGVAGGEAILSIARQVSLGHRFSCSPPSMQVSRGLEDPQQSGYEHGLGRQHAALKSMGGERLLVESGDAAFRYHDDVAGASSNLRAAASESACATS